MKIAFPLKPRMSGRQVGDLQNLLQLCLDRGVLLASDEGARRELSAALKRERVEQTYSDATRKLIGVFQKERQLQASGEVDEPTANALNALLKEWGLLDGETERVAPRPFVVSGQARREEGMPLPGMRVRATHQAPPGPVRLGEDDTDSEGRYTIRYEPPFGDDVNLRVTLFDANGKPLLDSELIRDAKPVEMADLVVPGAEVKSYQANGKVSSRISPSVSGVRVVIVDKGVGRDVPVAETKTDQRGHYQAFFSDAEIRRRGKSQPDLQARIFAGDTFLAASDVRYNASRHETLNVVLDDKAVSSLQSEYEVLTSALSFHFQGKLGDLKETDDQQDITFLANKTGWDARAVALAALADQFSARTAGDGGVPSIPQPYFYALFRAGLAANEDTLYHTDTATLESVWKQAAEQGVIPKSSADHIPNMTAQFKTLSAQKLLTAPSLTGASSLKELLAISRLNDEQQKKFAKLYTANRDNLAQFWKVAGDTFGNDVAARLQVDGKLGFLTINNAPLMLKVHTTGGANGIADLLHLAQTGFYRTESWRALLTEDIPTPKEIPGATPDKRRENYASYLAAQVRLSYPTATVAHRVKNGDLPLPGAAAGVAGDVHAFLTAHQGKFEMGVQPVEQYIAANKLAVAAETVKQVKRLERVYQITASDQAMTGLMKRGVDAAYHVVRYDKDSFVRTFSADLGSAEDAAHAYDRSVQIHNTVLNVALSYLNARTAPAIGVHSPPNVLDPTPANAGDVIAYATLDSLFGSMDFCPCDHCRSILSPAAYLVDLLMFLDQPNPPAGTENPQTVLLSRRPDIQHLPLTCDNTNTALPYIDVVTETLEYFIANTSQKLSLKDYPGHDTNGVASEDLLASPQFDELKVRDLAYTTLAEERFPAPLPFHQPLERLRRYFNKFEVPLPLAMERIRKNDNLERGATPYGWRDILMEEIQLSRAEHEILTDSATVPLWRMYGFPNGTADADVRAGLSNAKQFARRVGITYEDLILILRTRFINPNAVLIKKLERLGVSFAVLKALKDGAIGDAAFDDLLPKGLSAPDPAAYGGDVKAWVKDNANYARVMELVTLTIPATAWTANNVYAAGDLVRPTAPSPNSTLYFECTTAGTSAAAQPMWPTIPGSARNDGTLVWTCRDAANCSSFEHFAFRYSDPARLNQTIDAVEFFRLLRFIRLWRKLGWTIEQTDTAICTLFRADLGPMVVGDIDTVAKLDTGFLTLLPRLGIARRVINALSLSVKRDLASLLACWSQIETYGDGALYRQMFLSPALLQQDAIFADNGYGEFLGNGKVAAHAEALRSAFNLTGDEYDLIIAPKVRPDSASLGYDANTELTLPNVTAIFRRGWLARKLKLSVRELLLLIEFTGLDPFTSPNPASPAILRLTALVQALKDRSLKSSAALYLVWNQDLSGKSEPSFETSAALARTLRQGFVGVEKEFAVTDDPQGVIAQTRIATVYGAEAASTYFGMLNGTLTVEVSYNDTDGVMVPGVFRSAIENAAGKTDAGVPRIVYDDFRKQIFYSGVLTAATRDAIKVATGAGAAAFKTAVDSLFTKNQATIDPFFARFSELRPPLDAYLADAVHTPSEKRTTLLQAILPDLVQRRKRQQAIQSLTAAVSVDLSFGHALLDAPSAPFALHADAQVAKPGVMDVLALEQHGLTVQYFANDTATGAVIVAPDVASTLDYSPLVAGVGNPLPANPVPGLAVSGIWSGYLEAPETGFFNLRITVDGGASVKLGLDGQPVVLVQNGQLWTNAAPLNLLAGRLYSIALTVEKVRQVLRVEWEWQPKGQGRSVIAADFLYPDKVFAAFRKVQMRFLKATSLAAGLHLDADELAYFATNADFQINGDGWLHSLTTSGTPVHATGIALLKPFQALLDYARIKAEISLEDDSLLSVLKDPAAGTVDSNALLFAITRWDKAALNALLAHFNTNVAGLGQFETFRRVYDAFALAEKMGLSTGPLIQAVTNESAADTVRSLQAALRARYDADSWREVVQPINDEMRSLQRDALVAYILHQMRQHPGSTHIDTPDKLFEYFLMDVQMAPCMQTSRIRHALSSVQLFVERCLLNLEPRVSPASINGKQWEWMKRYRVWEANRKVYLFPENWLEPELRDDKSPFFKEIESELLQNEITEERATIALSSYLSKLEEVSKLEPCGIHHIPAEPARRTGEVNHVVARTAGAHRKYYYRRYEYGYWTPWEHIKLEIEDNPVLPVVWNDRLFLFWLRILQQPPSTPQDPISASDETNLSAVKKKEVKKETPSVRIQTILCWSEYFNGKWQATRTSDSAHPLEIDDCPMGSFDRSQVRLAVVFWTEGALRLIVSPIKGTGASFFLHNAHSLPELRADKKTVHFSQKRTFETSNSLLKVVYSGPNASSDVLTNDVVDRAIQPNHPIDSGSWEPPFFYEDARHAFYVTTEHSLVPVRIWDHYGVYLAEPRKQYEIPPMVFEPIQIIPDPVGPIIKQPGFGVTDPYPIERYVTEDAYIHRGLGSLGTVRYGDNEIGLGGSQVKSIRTK